MSTDEQTRKFRDLRRRQDGVFSVAQAREAGHTRAAVAARVRRGEWVREGSGVLRAADHPSTPRSRIRAAVLSVGEKATVVGGSAAYWWRIVDVAPAEIEIAVPHGVRLRPRPGVRLVRRTIDPEDRVEVDGVAVTKRAASVLTAAVGLGLLAGADLVDRALQTGVDIAQLRRFHLRNPGRYGAALASRLLVLANGGARFEAERTAHALLRRAGVAGWLPNHRVVLRGYGPAELDLAFVTERVLVEVDGWAYHRDLRAFLRDAARQNGLVLEGWTVIRTNWFELTTDPETFVRNVREALAANRTEAVRGPS